MKKKKFADPLVILTAEILGSDSGGNGSLGGGEGGHLDSIRPLPMSFDAWTKSSFCCDVDGSGGVDFADYTSWWNSNGFGEDSWLAYNPELAVAEEVIPDIGTDVLGEDFGA